MSRLSFAESLLYFTILFLLCIIFAMNAEERACKKHGIQSYVLQILRKNSKYNMICSK